MRRRRTSAAFAGLGLTILMSACGDSPVAPVRPPVPEASPVGTGVLSGVVFEMAAGIRAPVEDVEVNCQTCGHVMAFTGASGAYSFEGVRNGLAELTLAKPGYKLVRPDVIGPGGIGWMGTMVAPVIGDTRFDIEIARQ
jgi:hypothetical protein